MSSADKLKHFFKKAELRINPDSDEKVFQDVFDAHQKTIKSRPAQPVNIGRIIMKNHFKKFAAAAVVIIACIAGLAMLDKTSSIAIADVLRHFEEINSYKYNLKIRHRDEIADNKSDRTTQSEVIRSKEYGIKSKMDIFNTNNKNDVTKSESYYLPKDRSQITINHFSKKYIKITFDTALLSTQSDGYNDPYEMVKRFLKNGYKSLGVSDINGNEVEVFQTNEQVEVSGLNAISETKLYVDLKTSLPIKIESITYTEGVVEKTDVNYHLEVVYSDFEWNVSVNPLEFVPVIPDDYTLTIDVGINEENLIKGLYFYTELFGNYPEDLDPDKLTSLSAIILKSKIPAAIKLQEQIKKQTDNPAKINQLLSENMSSISNAGTFYQILYAQKKDKDPAYYGDKVSPGDANNVLMRWKISDNEYRVIFGNLRVETVPFETLVRLEQNMPKE